MEQTEHKSRKLIFFILYLAYTSIYVARVNLSVAGPSLIDENIINTVQIGLLGSVFSTVYAVGRLINGGLSDRNPPWMMLSVGLGLAGLSNICISFFPPFIAIFLLWTSNAYAQSMLWSSVLCVVSRLYKPEIVKQKTAIMVTSVAMGNIVGILINTFLIVRFGTRFAFLIPGLITIILGLVILFVTHDIKPISAVQGKHISMLQLIRDKSVAAMSVPAILHGVMKENVSLWMVVYIVDRFSIDLSQSSYYVLMIPLIGFIGRMAYPLLYKLCKERENIVSVLGFAACIAGSILLFSGKINMVVSVLCLSIIYAAASMINTSILSIFPIRFLKTGNVASVSGLMDFATYLGAGITSVIYGVIIKQFGYWPMFLSWAVISVISIIVIVRTEKQNHSAES